MVANDTGCGKQECDLPSALQPRYPTGRAAVMISICDEELAMTLDTLHCGTHQFFFMMKCGMHRMSVPVHLAACSTKVDLGWCRPGYNHCANFYFMLNFYSRMNEWDVVYFFKGTHNGGTWTLDNDTSMASLIQFHGRDIGYEDFGSKSIRFDVKAHGKHWTKTARWLGCMKRRTHWTTSPRNNFAVSTQRILSWPKCKYQWLLHTLFFPPTGTDLVGARETWRFFEHCYSRLFSCAPRIKPKPKGTRSKFLGLGYPHHFCSHNSTSS
mmetsp:Transcript_34745/g.88910  ORF Transcript_34745/g.88910 Transcript_34745/m.88910 type:complete len:268 (+) Transcript_34745:564-1367(+)